MSRSRAKPATEGATSSVWPRVTLTEELSKVRIITCVAISHPGCRAIMAVGLHLHFSLPVRP